MAAINISANGLSKQLLSESLIAHYIAILAVAGICHPTSNNHAKSSRVCLQPSSATFLTSLGARSGDAQNARVLVLHIPLSRGLRSQTRTSLAVGVTYDRFFNPRDTAVASGLSGFGHLRPPLAAGKE